MERIPEGHDSLQLQGAVMMVGMMMIQKMRKTEIRHTLFKDLMIKPI